MYFLYFLYKWNLNEKKNEEIIYETFFFYIKININIYENNIVLYNFMY